MRVQREPSRAQVLETFAVISVVFLVVSVFTQRQIFVWLALLLLLLPLTTRATASFLTHRWLKVAELIAGLNNRIILTLIFFVVLTPLAFVYRIFNKNPLRLERDASVTFYAERNHVYTGDDLRKMW